MIDGWYKIYSSDEEYQAELIMSLLKNNGLTPVLFDKKDDGFRLGYADVYVSPAEVEKAKAIMDENQKK